MYYKNLEEVDNRVIQIVHNKVKRYLTDWIYYDWPKFEIAKESKRDPEKELLLIARDCGTYLFFIDELKIPDSQAVLMYNFWYQATPKDVSYYYINLKTFEVRMIRNKEKFLQNIVNPV